MIVAMVEGMTRVLGKQPEEERMKDQIARIIDPACWPPEGGFRQYQLTRNMEFRRSDSIKKAEEILKVVLAGSKAAG